MREVTSAFLFAASLLLWLTATPARAIPAHRHGATGNFTTAESDGDRGANETHDHAGVTTEAGDSPHQHYDADADAGGWNDTQADTWSAFGAWDDETFYLDNTDPFDGPYAPVWHGFIDEFATNTDDDSTIPATDDQIPDYFFKDAWDADAKARVADAFAAWSALAAGMSPVSGLVLKTGLEFEETTVETNAEILLLWTDIADLGLTSWANNGANTEGGITVKFDSNPGQSGWYFSVDPSGTPADKFHFYSTALHELGHVVGLDEQDDSDDVMIRSRLTGKNDPPAEGPAFGALDADSKKAAYVLYSIPVPEPASGLLLGLGVLGLGARRRLKRG